MHRFRNWAAQKVPGAKHMNVGSGAQIRQLLFAGVENQKPEKGTLEDERVFKVVTCLVFYVQVECSSTVCVC